LGGGGKDRSSPWEDSWEKRLGPWCEETGGGNHAEKKKEEFGEKVLNAVLRGGFRGEAAAYAQYVKGRPVGSRGALEAGSNVS